MIVSLWLLPPGRPELEHLGLRITLSIKTQSQDPRWNFLTHLRLTPEQDLREENHGWGHYNLSYLKNLCLTDCQSQMCVCCDPADSVLLLVS